MHHISRGKAGFSLTAALVAIGITGMVAAAMSTIYKNSSKAGASLRERDDLEVLKRTMLFRVNCSTTMANAGGAAACAGNLVDVYDGVGVKFISAAGQKFGEWTVRGTCNADGSVFMEAARLTPSGNVNSLNGTASAFYADKLNSSIIWNWAGSQKLFFPAGTTPCGATSPPILGTFFDGSAIITTYQNSNAPPYAPLAPNPETVTFHVFQPTKITVLFNTLAYWPVSGSPPCPGNCGDCYSALYLDGNLLEIGSASLGIAQNAMTPLQYTSPAPLGVGSHTVDVRHSTNNGSPGGVPNQCLFADRSLIVMSSP